MFTKKTVRDVDVANKVVLVRTDYNIPLYLDHETNAWKIANDYRIRAGLPTLQYLLEHRADKIILISHLGRPDGRPSEDLSLRVVAEHLAELLPGVNVNFVSEVSGPEVEAAVEDLPTGSILLLENLRFSPSEQENSELYASDIVSATGAELFVQDGFAVTHRAHASTDAITRLLPSVAGLLLEKEILTLTKTITNPDHPFVVIIGGAKVTDKQPLIEKLTPIADQILVGGKIAADGYQAESPRTYVAEDFDETAAGEKLDIGPVATGKFISALQPAKTVFWNGVLGKVEDPTYATSSTIVAKFLGENSQITSVVCGGDTVGFVEQLQNENPALEYTLLSTGGGAALAFLSGEPLPGLTGLEDK